MSRRLGEMVRDMVALRETRPSRDGGLGGLTPEEDAQLTQLAHHHELDGENPCSGPCCS